VGGGLWLTNGYHFIFENGYVFEFNRTTENPWLSEDPATDWPHYVGKDNMTTNDAITMARQTLVKLGYDPRGLHADTLPTSIEGPNELREGHFPYCKIEWSIEPKTEEDTNETSLVQFFFNMTDKSIIGLNVINRKLHRPNPKVDVVPELESDYRKNHHGNMVINTNAPKTLSFPAPKIERVKTNSE
jgi:hypothetical protein